MRVLHLADTYYPQINGITIAVDGYTHELTNQGHDVMIVFPTTSLKGSYTQEGRLTKVGIASIPFIFYPGLRIACPNLFDLFWQLKKFKPEVLHVHVPGMLGNLGVLLGKLLKIPVIGTYHTLLSSYAFYMDPKRAFQQKKFFPQVDQKSFSSRASWFLLNQFYNTCTLVTAPTNIVATEILSHGITKTIVFVPNGLDIQQFPLKESFHKPRKLLHLGRLGYEKSVDVVIEAFAIVHKKHPALTLTIAGDGPARQELEKLVSELGLQTYITFLGSVPHNEVSAIYKAHDLFISASTSETQGIVLIEAMLSGLPIIAAGEWGPVDLVDKGKNGYLFEAGNPEKCAEAIEILLEHPDKIKTMGMSARKYAEQFNITKVTKRLVDAYKLAIRSL